MAPTVGAAMTRWRSSRGQRGVRRRDPLTGLAQREDLLRRGPGLLAQASAEHRPAALLLLDLDGFKGVNDAAGHHVGDRVLAAIGARLEEVSEPDDLVVRLGGDEFAVLTGPLGRRDAGAARALAIIEAVSAPIEVDDLRVAVGVSVGLATYAVDGSTVEELLRAADQAMYAAKADGSGQWRSSTPAGQGENGRTQRLLADLESGRAPHELVVHYQPQVGLAPHGSGAEDHVVGFEALVRWEHPELGLLLPRQFIPLAERSGLMGPITEAVLERSLTDLPRLQHAAPGARLSLNVTRRHILGRGLVDDLRTRTRRHDVSPRHVVLEITEPVTRASSETAATFNALSKRGFEVSIRGFGTARSSLTALWSNPAVREVKLAPSIVQALQHREDPVDPEAVRLLRALTSAAHGLGIRVVAEGVEDHASVQGLRDLRCDVLQGFWICPPSELAHVEAWCDSWSGRA